MQNTPKIDEIICPQHKEFKEFIKYLLIIDPTKRPTVEEALSHNFLSENNKD